VVLGVLSGDLERARSVALRFAERHGGVVLWGAPAPFDQTGYYEVEMGQGLQRFYCACADLVPQEELPAIKRQAWDLEQQQLEGARRRVNLDPGVLDHTKVVLASFKAGPQKLHLGGGIWADLVLYYSHGAYGPLPWTFPDLRGGDHARFFAEARQVYKARLRDLGRPQGGSVRAPAGCSSSPPRPR
jgi:hypothetical protein